MAIFNNSYSKLQKLLLFQHCHMSESPTSLYDNMY